MKRVLVIFIALLFSYFLILRPIFGPGFFLPHDFTHAGRIVEMYRGLVAGNFPVRWSANFGFGYGMPLFSFYAPLPYYIGAIPYAITQDAIFSIKFLYALSSALLILGVFLFSSTIWGVYGGAIGALVITYSQYSALNMYVRGDLGELFAHAFFPYIFWALFRKKKNSVLGVFLASIFFACTILSHNLTGMVTGGLLLVLGVSLFLVPKKRMSGLSTFGVFSLGIFLSAFYALPAYIEKSFTRVEETITTGYFDYHNHFLALRQFIFGAWGYGGSIFGLEDGMSFALGNITIALLFFGVCVFIYLCYKKKLRDDQLLWIIFFSITAFGSLFLASNRSVFIWDHLPLLRFLQFPWRFLGFAHSAIAICIAGVFSYTPKKLQLPIFLSLSILYICFSSRYFVPREVLSKNQLDTVYDTSPEYIKKTLSKTLNDYLPNAIQGDHYPVPIDDRLSISQDGALYQVQSSPEKIHAYARCAAPCVLQIRVFRFPSWSIYINGKQEELKESADFPTYQYTLPSGESTITVQLDHSSIQRYSLWLSAISWICVMLGYIFYATRK